MIDETQLAADQAVCDAATPGPWYVGKHPTCTVLYAKGPFDCCGAERCSFYNGYDENLADATFVTQARTLLPAYIAEVRLLQEANAALLIISTAQQARINLLEAMTA